MKKNIEELKKKIAFFVAGFVEKAKKEHWVSRYDSENDSLAFINPKLSKDSRKHYVDDEIAMYFNKTNDVQGIFIEYFVSNFLAHHKNFKNLEKELKNQTNVEATIELDKKATEELAPNLESVMLNSLINIEHKELVDQK